MTSNSALTYADYLNLEQILSAQHPASATHPSGEEHDELLFIVVHQVYELWFKQLLHEIDFVIERLQASELGRALHTLKRVRAVLKVIVSQVDVLETMTPLEFNSFRNRLDSASGLQSYQFRELEFVLGLKRVRVLERYADQPEIYARLQRRLDAPNLWQAFLAYLQSEGYPIPDTSLDPQQTQTQTEPSLHDVLTSLYRSSPILTELCEALTDVDEGLQEWRYRHVKMVQRTIGAKPGTGGTSGVAYLESTLSTPLFPDLWAIRAKL